MSKQIIQVAATQINVLGVGMELSPFLRQAVKTQNSANGVKIPSNGGLSHGFVSTAVYTGVQAGRPAAAGGGGLGRGSGQQALEIDFLKGCLQRIEEQRQLQAVREPPLSTARSKGKKMESKP